MGDWAVQVEGLSKLYYIGQAQNRRGTLRDEIGAALASSGHWLTSMIRHHEPNGKGRKEETIWALKDVTFEVGRGEVFGIIGRNGAGKSTLLKILSRITTPTTGRARVQGQVGSLLEVGTGFHPELTGRENIYLNGSILGVRKADIERAFDEIVAFAEVEKFIDTPVKFYSTGMYVRLAFAVATHFTPEILIVDEVLAVGDTAFQQKCLERMADIGRGGRTVLLVSHNLGTITQLAGRVMWLEGGRVAEIGDARDVTARYLEAVQGKRAPQPLAPITLPDLPLGEKVIASPPHVNGAAMSRAYVMDANQQVRSSFPFEDPFYIAIEYWVKSWVNGLRAEFRLRNERGQTVLRSTTTDSTTTAPTIGAPGSHRVYACVPGGWLAPGRYRVEVALCSPEVGDYHRLTEMFAFDIRGNNFQSTGDEVLRPILTWSME